MEKLTNDQLHQLNVDIETAIKNSKDWRRGQAHFNVLHKHYPKIADKIRGNNKFDCFYNDLLIPGFWTYLMEHLYLHD